LEQTGKVEGLENYGRSAFGEMHRKFKAKEPFLEAYEN
jgi:hypothetical protein